MSLLVLGAAPPPPVRWMRPALPGIEVMHIAPPTLHTVRMTMPTKVSASGVVLLDLSSGEELLARRADLRHPMASLTKIMTALLMLERHGPGEIITVSAGAENIPGSTLGLKAGEHFALLSLLRGMLVSSANDAAYAFAIADSGTVQAFVENMNRRADTLGLKNTHFTNPAGLDGAQQYSTARDMAWLAMAALKKPVFRSIVATKTARIFSREGKEFDLRNTNELLHDNRKVFGVKTGTTANAGECLIVLFEERGRLYLLVLLGSADRYTDSLYIMKAVHDSLVPPS